jgi:hypothetical protein
MVLYPTNLPGVFETADLTASVGTLPRAFYTSFNMMMGDYDIEMCKLSPYPWLAVVALFLYVVIVNLVMLNLLIALMGGSCKLALSIQTLHLHQIM